MTSTDMVTAFPLRPKACLHCYVLNISNLEGKFLSAIRKLCTIFQKACSPGLVNINEVVFLPDGDKHPQKLTLALIGVVCSCVQVGFYLEKLPEVFVKVEKKLVEIGLPHEDNLYIKLNWLWL